MIIRRRVLLEADNDVELVQMKKDLNAKQDQPKELNTTKEFEHAFYAAYSEEDKAKVVDEAVKKFIFNNKEDVNFQNFKNLRPDTKIDWIEALDFDTLNEKMFPFFSFLKNISAKDIISDINDSFLKLYNFCVEEKPNYSDCTKYSILCENDLYRHNDYDKIAEEYLNIDFKDSWIKKCQYISDKEIREQFINMLNNTENNNINKSKFIKIIFFDKNNRVRPYGTISRIINELNSTSGKETKSNSDVAKKAIKNITKNSDIKDVVDSFNKEQAAIAIPILQQKVNS